MSLPPSLHHRPTFALRVPAAAESVQIRLQQRLVDPRLEVTWARTPGAAAASDRTETHVLITFRADHRHFWSPWLHLDLQVEEHQTRVHGRFSPHPSVWTGFAFGYMSLAVVTFFALVFGYSQTVVGTSPVALAVIPVAVAIAALMWWSAQIGQRLAREQMTQIRALLEEALGDAEPEASARSHHLAPHVQA